MSDTIQQKPMVLNKKFSFLLKRILLGKIPQVDIDTLQKFPSATLLLDVREENEYKISSIEGAIKIPGSRFDTTFLKDIEPSQKLIVFCSVGLRSQKICGRLMKDGFTEVYNLYGGIFEWVNRGLPVVNGEGHQCDLIHGFSPLWGVWVSRLKKVYR